MAESLSDPLSDSAIQRIQRPLLQVFYDGVLEPAYGGAYRSKPLRRSDEQSFRVGAVANHLRVDRRLVVLIEPEAGEILEAHVVVVVDLRIGHPGPKVRLLAGESAEQIFGRGEAHFGERATERRVIRTVQLRLNCVDVDLGRALLADEHDVVAGAVERVAEDH